jgi:thiamine-phosphate pyrophosphorylase
VPIETIKAARSRTVLSVFAAGGITPENAHVVLEAGVDGIAVTSAILRAKNPEQAARSLRDIVYRYNVPAS